MSLKDIFKTTDGDIVIGQMPNTPLLIALVFYLLRFLPYQFFVSVGEWGMTISILYWSYLEMTDGVNKFRKILGLVVMIFFLIKFWFLVPTIFQLSK